MTDSVTNQQPKVTLQDAAAATLTKPTFDSTMH